MFHQSVHSNSQQLKGVQDRSRSIRLSKKIRANEDRNEFAPCFALIGVSVSQFLLVLSCSEDGKFCFVLILQQRFLSSRFQPGLPIRNEGTREYDKPADSTDSGTHWLRGFRIQRDGFDAGTPPKVERWVEKDNLAVSSS